MIISFFAVSCFRRASSAPVVSVIANVVGTYFDAADAKERPIVELPTGIVSSLLLPPSLLVLLLLLSSHHRASSCALSQLTGRSR